MRHPFQSIKASSRSRIFWFLLAAAVLLTVIMNWISQPLITPAAPYGIVSFELAGTAARSHLIIASWDKIARLYAAFGLGLDYLYMVVYSFTIGLGCILAAEALYRGKFPLGSFGALLAWGLWLAALLDALENIALAVQLLEQGSSPWPLVALVCASAKFSLIFLGLVYAFYGLAMHAAARLTRR